MAQRRMLNIDLILDDSFAQDLSLEAQNMYIYLNMLADDDGIITHLNRNLRMLGKGETPIDELIKAGFISRYDEQTIFITDWLVNNHLRKDRYIPSKAAECRDALYIDYNWKYTLDINSARIVIKYSKWIDQDRKIADKPINKLSLIDMKELAQYNFQKRNKITGNQSVTSKSPSGNQPVTTRLPLGIGIGKGSSKGSGQVQVTGSGKGSGSDQVTKYVNSSSNGGLGEILLQRQPSTSSLVNNATRESGEDSGVTTGVNSTESLDSKGDKSNNQSSKHNGTNLDPEWQPNGSKPDPERYQSNDNNEAVSYLFDSVNSAFNSDIPYDDERLKVLFDDLLNQYKENYIQDGIVELADSNAIQQTNNSVKNLVVNHLADSIKAVIKQ